MKSPRVTPLHFRTLQKQHKSFKQQWETFKAFLLGLFVLTGLVYLLAWGIHQNGLGSEKDTLGVGNIISDIVSGFIGGGVVTVLTYFHKTGHNQIYYAHELQWYVNHAQTRYQITYDDAGNLLKFDNEFLMVIDNFFRYVSTDKETEMLPRIQKFGSLILPQEKGYLRLTMYWQQYKGFFLTEEEKQNLTDFN